MASAMATTEDRRVALTAWQAAGAMEAGHCTSQALVQSVLDAITAGDEHLGAYVAVDADDALRQARAADASRAGGRCGPLLGVPIAVKDLINVSGQSCQCGSRILDGYVAPYDATAVARLRAAGAVLLGRTNMDEFGMGSTTENSALRMTRNPHDPGRVPGGSSGGSAAAVAGGEAIVALGSDTGGSIRQPAAFCGCVGLKPSYGRVSRYGLTAYASSLDQIGPLARDVRDAATVLSVIAGPDPMDSTALDLPVPDYLAGLDAGVRGLRLGLPRQYFVEGLAPELRACHEVAIAVLRDLGATIVEVDLPHTEYAIAAYYIIATAEASANLARFDGVRYGKRCEGASDPLDHYLRTRAAGFGQEVKRRIILGTYVLSSGYYDAYYISAQKVRTLIHRDFEQAFRHCDALLTPCTPTAAYRIGENAGDPLRMYLGDVYTVPASLAGLCGLSVPCGTTAAGLPVGLQILGAPFAEPTILRVGQALEKAAGVQGGGGAA